MYLLKVRKPDASVIDAAWLLYNEIFTAINEDAVQRHLMYWEEFIDVMHDDRIIKYFVYDMELGSMVGLSVLTNSLRSWPLISPAYFQKHYPTYYERDAVWYCGFVGVREGTSPTAFTQLVTAMLEDIRSNDGMTVMDFCMVNSRTRRLPLITGLLIRRLVGTTPRTMLDEQEFHAYFPPGA